MLTRTMRLPACALCACLVSTACKKSAPPDPAPAEGATPAVSASASAPAPKPRSPAISDTRAQSLLRAWVAAQNAGRFDEYRKFYAARFVGIKRVGDKLSRFDRAGWLADREKMFAVKFQINATGVATRSVGNTTVLAFTQTYSSPNFTDTGPKQLVLVLEHGQPKISREEMLRSEVGHRLSALEFPLERFSFIRTVGGRRYWVAGNVSAAGQTILAPPEYVAVGAAFAPVDPKRLPAAVRPFVGRRVTGSGKGCQATLTEWGVLADFEPHFGTVQEWEGLLPGQQPTPERRIAREVFGEDTVESDGIHRVAADITDQTASCEDWLYARDVKMASAPDYAETHLLQAELEAIRGALRKTRDYLQAQRAFASENPGKGRWDEALGVTLQVTAVALEDDRFAIASFQHSEGCGGFEASVRGVFRSTDGGWIRLPASVPGWVSYSQAVDLNGDGMPEWLSEFTVLGWDGKAYGVVLDVSPPSFDCPC